MQVANIREFRSALHAALEASGFIARRFEPKAPIVWTLPREQVVPLFFPHAIRRPWGFNLSGVIGIEIPELRAWLQSNRPDEGLGVFRDAFVTWHIANAKALTFMADTNESVPFDHWTATLKECLSSIPATPFELVSAYMRAPNTLLGLASPLNKPAWDFLVDWLSDRQTARPVPQRL